MRVTNQMVSANTMLYLNNSQSSLLQLQQQLTTGKVIGKPSDDPIIAVRGLKLKTDISEIQQYKRNTNDALSWMKVTEQSMSNMTDIYKKVRELSVQGSSQTYAYDEQVKILKEIKQLAEQLKHEGNASYAGRSVFTGYRTDKPLVYTKNDPDRKVDISQNFEQKDMDIKKIVVPGEYRSSTDVTSPKTEEVYRLRLGYKNIEVTDPTKDITVGGMTLARNVINSDDPNAYNPPAGTINILKDTGEVIFNSADGKNIVDSVPNFKLDIKYTKTGFKKGDQMPEHYYDVDVYQKKTGIEYDAGKMRIADVPVKIGSVENFKINGTAVTDTIEYYNPDDNTITRPLPAPGTTLTVTSPPPAIDTDKVRVNIQTGEVEFGSATPPTGPAKAELEFKTEMKAKNQGLEYEISVNQRVEVNTLGNNVLTTDALRDLQEIIDKVMKDVEKVEALKKEMENVKKDTTLTDKEKEMKTKFLKDEVSVYQDVIADYYSSMIGQADGALKTISEETALIGGKINRMELTVQRLEDNKLNFTELLNTTENIDFTEKMIELQSQKVVYNSALMSSAKMIQPTLLEYLR